MHPKWFCHFLPSFSPPPNFVVVAFPFFIYPVGEPLLTMIMGAPEAFFGDSLLFLPPF